MVLLLCYYQVGVNAAAVAPTMMYRRRLVRISGTRFHLIGFAHHRCRCKSTRSIATSLPLSKRDDTANDDRTVSNIAIVGGGLAGMSTAYHLLDMASRDDAVQKGLRITVFDKTKVGEGGASSVAGG